MADESLHSPVVSRRLLHIEHLHSYQGLQSNWIYYLKIRGYGYSLGKQ
jgi:hypothetical protein